MSVSRWAAAAAAATGFALIAALALVATEVLTTACGRAPDRPTSAPSAASRTSVPSVARRGPAPAGPAPLRYPATLTAADALCSAENAQEMGTARLGPLYGAHSSGYLTVQKVESVARRELRAALAKLPIKDFDRTSLGRLLADQDAVLNAREALLTVVARQPPQVRLAPLTGPRDLVVAYRGMIDAYLAAGRDFLAAGLPSCATPLITVLYGPGQAEASAATVEFRISAACPTVSYSTVGSGGTLTAALGSVMQPGTHKPGDRYDSSSGPVNPPVRHDEVVVLTSNHYPVASATCAGTGAGIAGSSAGVAGTSA